MIAKSKLWIEREDGVAIWALPHVESANFLRLAALAVYTTTTSAASFVGAGFLAFFGGW